MNGTAIFFLVAGALVGGFILGTWYSRSQIEEQLKGLTGQGNPLEAMMAAAKERQRGAQKPQGEGDKGGA